MRTLFTVYLFLSAWAAFAQSDRGTITGTVSDPTNAVIPGANVVAPIPKLRRDTRRSAPKRATIPWHSCRPAYIRCRSNYLDSRSTSVRD